MPLSDKPAMEGESFEGDARLQALASYDRFSGCRLTACDLTGRDMGGKEFQDCVFTGCNLSLAKFTNCTLSEVSFASCKLIGIDFSAANKPTLFKPFRRLDDCLVEMCNFSGLNMREVRFEGCTLRKCTFGETDLRDSTFGYSDLEGTAFHHADLSRADFTRARNYTIDPSVNKVNKAKFSVPEVLSLLRGFDIVLE
jgi:fluoroquinolone resistance protein